MAVVTMYFPGNVYPESYNPSLPFYDYNPSLGELLDLTNAVVSSKSSKLETFQLQNGLVAKFIGTGFTYDAEGQVSGGTLTQIQLLLSNGTTLQQRVAGLSVAFGDFMGAAASYGTWGSVRFLMNGGDTITGSAGDDDLEGHAGDDTLKGGAGDDYMVGGAGTDTYDGGTGNFDTLAFNDTYYDPTALHGVTLDASAKTVIDPWGNHETFNNIEQFRGSLFADSLKGSAAAETFAGLGGRDTIDGGGGIDAVRYDKDVNYGGARAVTVDLSAGYAIDGFGKRDTLSNIENVFGTGGNDTIIGNAVANLLAGGSGADTLTGGLGTAQDQFDYRKNSHFGDLITDFQSGIDKIVFEDSISFLGHTMSVYNGPTLASQTSSTAEALFFDTSAHVLYYDANGATAGGAVQIATLAGVSGVTHGDFIGIG